MQTDQSPGFFNPGQHVGLVYADRMRTEADKAQVTTLILKPFTVSVITGVCDYATVDVINESAM